MEINSTDAVIAFAVLIAASTAGTIAGLLILTFTQALYMIVRKAREARLKLLQEELAKSHSANSPMPNPNTPGEANQK